MASLNELLSGLQYSTSRKRAEILEEILALDPAEVVPVVLLDSYKWKDTDEEDVPWLPVAPVLNALVPLHPDILRLMLTHPDDKVRAGAAYEMGRHAEGRSIDALIEALRTDPAPQVRVSALETLATGIGQDDISAVNRPDLVDVLAPAISHPLPQQRYLAITALGKLHDQNLAPLLATAIDDPSEWVRRGVIEALGNAGNTEAIPFLIDRLRNETGVEIRGEAMRSLGMLKAREAVPYLVRGLYDYRRPKYKYGRKHSENAVIACAALEQIGTPRALSAVRLWHLFQYVLRGLGFLLFLIVFIPFIAIVLVYGGISKLLRLLQRSPK